MRPKASMPGASLDGKDAGRRLRRLRAKPAPRDAGIANSHTAGGGNSCVSGWTGVLVDDNVFDGQALR